MNDTTVCLICTRDLYDDETGAYACRLCQAKADRYLAEIAGPRGLYALASLDLEPTRGSSGPRVSGTGSAPVPLDIRTLDYTADGGMVSTLESWVTDWATYGFATPGTSGRLQHRVDQAVATLRFNLATAVWQHPAFDAFAQEVRQIHGRLTAIVDGGRESPQFKVACTCGRTVRFAVDTPSITCPGCRTGYGLEEIRRLAADQRSAA